MKKINIFIPVLVLMLVITSVSPVLLKTGRASGPHPVTSASKSSAQIFGKTLPKTTTNITELESDIKTSMITPELVGQVGGRPTDVAWHDNLAYIGIGKHLIIVDTSDPSQPSTIGRTSMLPEAVTAVKVVGNYAYVAAGEGGLRIIDLSDPTTPIETGFYDTPGYIQDVSIAGSYAYLADRSIGLRIINISNPSAPTEIGVCATYPLTPPNGLAVAGNYAYIARHGGVTIIDISDPAAPTEIGNADTQGIGYAVAVAGNYAYLASEEAGLRIINISNPVSPTETGFFDTPLPGKALDVTVEGDYAYVADGEGGLIIIDVSDPSVPIEVGSINFPGEIITGHTLAVTVAGNLAYIIYDAYFDTLGLVDYIENSGLYIVNIADRAAPTEIGSYVSPGVVEDVTVVGDYAYLAAQNGGLHIVDISNPNNLVVTGFYDTPGTAYCLAVLGNYAYVADGDSGLRIIDVSNPATPTEAGYFDTPGSAKGVAIAGNYIYVADAYYGGWGISGLYIIDISNPASPIELGFYKSPENARYVTVVGDYAYLATENGLRIIAISNPASPIGIGFYNALSDAFDVTIAGKYAYVAVYSGLRIVDVTNPAAPVETGSYNLTGNGQGVAVKGNYAYLASRECALHIISISNPEAPLEAGYYGASADPMGGWTGVTVVGNHAYFANYINGLFILRLVTEKITNSLPPTGGSLTTIDGNTTLTFPEGVFTQTVKVVYGQLLYDESAGNLVGIGNPFEVTAFYSDTGKSVMLAPNQTFTVTLDYSDANLGVAIEDTIALYYWNGVEWVKEATSSVDTTNDILIATPDHLSLWAVFVETERVHMPLLAQSHCLDFFDDYSDQNSGWYIGQDSEGIVEYLGGEYRVLVKPVNFSFLLGAPGCPRTNYTVGADARWSGNSGASYGLLFGIKGDYEQFYSFEVNSDYQEYALYRYGSGGWIEIVPYTHSPEIHPGAGRNHLAAARIGSAIILSVNGNTLGTWTDSTITGSSYSGLIVSSCCDMEDAEARFDNYSVTGLGSTAGAATASFASDLGDTQAQISTYRQSLKARGWR